MRLHGRAIDQDLRRRSTGRCECVEYVYPYALRCPADEAIVECFARTIVECFARTIDLRRIDPAPTGLQNLDNAADDPLIIDPRLAARIIRQKRFENSELILR
jgi:hypothetical protein